MYTKVILDFVDAINHADTERMVGLMTDDHIFVDSRDNALSGKDNLKQAWKFYFELFPDYTIEITGMLQNKSHFCMYGYTSGTYKNLKNADNSNYWRIPAAWNAIIDNNRIKFWQVYADNGIVMDIVNRNHQTAITMKRTTPEDNDFRELVKELDIDLKKRDGEEHVFYAQFNKTDTIRHVVVAYEGQLPVGCGALKEYSIDAMEVKRMFVVPDKRGNGIASKMLYELENWSKELGYKKCVLETGKKQPEAIRLYQKNQYAIIPNYGQYEGVENSICFEKEL
jgi:putative acetyltransferase